RVAEIRDDRLAPDPALDFVGQQVKRPPRLAGQAAEGQFLDPVAEPQLEVTAAVVRSGRAEEAFPLRLQLDHRHSFERRKLRDHVHVRRVAFARPPWRGVSLSFCFWHHCPPTRLLGLRRPTRRLRARMSNELSWPGADKELDCSDRIRLSPAARICASSSRRSPADRRTGNRGFGPDRASCMRPYGRRKTKICNKVQWLIAPRRNHSK